MSPQEHRIAELRRLIERTNAGKSEAGRRTLGDDLRVRGGLYFGGVAELVELPDGLTVAGDCLLRATGLRALPENLRVYGTLNLVGTAVSALPASLKVFGNLDIRRTRIGAVDAAVCLGRLIRTDRDAEEAPAGLSEEIHAALTGMDELPVVLQKLIAFQNQHGYESFCQGFGIHPETNAVFRTWTRSETLLSQLFCIGQANGGGSLYAIWRARDDAGLDRQPVVAFGDEGGAWVVARTLVDFLRVLSFDREPSISPDGIAFGDGGGEGDGESPQHRKFVAYIKKHFDVAKLKKRQELDALLQEARAAHQQPLLSLLSAQ